MSCCAFTHSVGFVPFACICLVRKSALSEMLDWTRVGLASASGGARGAFLVDHFPAPAHPDVLLGSSHDVVVRLAPIRAIDDKIVAEKEEKEAEEEA